MHPKAIALEGHNSQTFSEVVSILTFAVTLHDVGPAIRISLRMMNMRPKEVVLHTEVLGPCSDTLVSCQQKTTHVVFKD